MVQDTCKAYLKRHESRCFFSASCQKPPLQQREKRPKTHLYHAVDRLPLRLRLRRRVARIVDLRQVPSPSGESADVPLLARGPIAHFIADVEVRKSAAMFVFESTTQCGTLLPPPQAKDVDWSASISRARHHPCTFAWRPRRVRCPGRLSGTTARVLAPKTWRIFA